MEPARNGLRSGSLPPRSLWVLVVASWLLAPALLTGPSPAHASSSEFTYQTGAFGTEDATLRQDKPDQPQGTQNTLILRATDRDSRKQTVIAFPLAWVFGRTILQATLGLTQVAATDATAIDARVSPVIETWSESQVTWDSRWDGSAWTVPGGTHAARWTDRAQVASATNGTLVGWEVGPAMLAAQLGTQTLTGFLIEATADLPDREVQFAASEASDAATRPRLVLRTTDEPPSVRSGRVEVQPRRVPTGAVGVPLTLWLDVDASGSTPSGTATGFDDIRVNTGGLLTVTAIDAVTIGGVAQSVAASSFASASGVTTFHIPRVQDSTRVRVDFRATVSGTSDLDLRVTVDDTATPGCWEQALWPGDADGVAGNGDDWRLAVEAASPVQIVIVPDTLRTPMATCVAFTVLGITAGGDTVTVVPDVVTVDPAKRGSASTSGLFCASDNSAGQATLVATHGALADTAAIVVENVYLPTVNAVRLLDETDAPATALVPGDTMFIEAQVGDWDGFKDVTRLDFDVAIAGHADDLDAPAFRAHVRWDRDPAPVWTLVTPVGASWAVLPALSTVDAASNNWDTLTVRLAFRVGRVARASHLGEWTARVSAYSVSPPATAADSLTGIDCRTRLVLAPADTTGAFSWGKEGATGLPLGTPADGTLAFEVEANAAWALEAGVTDLAGLSTPTDTLFTGAPGRPVQWALGAATPAGRLDSALVALSAPVAASVTEAGITSRLALWIDLPAGLAAQAYRGDLRARLRETGSGAVTSVTRLPLTATVASSGLAAQAAVAEVAPDTVVAGTPARSFVIHVRPSFDAFDSGIDRLRIALPAGYSNATVTDARVAGLPVGFTDHSVPGTVEARLASKVILPLLIQLTMSVDVATLADPTGADFAVSFDDFASPAPPQSAVPGDADGIASEEGWHVTVVPGPLARIAVTPDTLATFVGDATPFETAGEDAYGNPVAAPIVWSVLGGVGTLDAGGRFVATAAGSGAVVATSGTVADTSTVEVWVGRGLTVRAVHAPASLHQTQTGASVRVRIENLGNTTLLLDQLALAFGRLNPGDADADYTWRPSSPLPAQLAAGADTTIAMSVDVAVDATLGPVQIDARASALEIGTGTRYGDTGADSVAVAQVTAGGLVAEAVQDPRTVAPGGLDEHVITLRVRNLHPEPRTLSAITLRNTTSGAGGQETLDHELGEVTLHLDDGDGVFDPRQDRSLLRTVAIAGAVHVAPLSVVIAGADTVTVFVSADLPLGMRDGDVLDLALSDASDLTVLPPSTFRNAFPLAPVGGLRVDGMVAAQITAEAACPSALKPGVADQLALQVVLPANGYVPDTLERLAVRTLGTALPGSDVTRVSAWVDDGDGTFAAATDRRLGTLAYTGDRWELSGIAEPVALSGLRVFVTVDVSATAREGLTVRLAIPGGAFPGAGMRSGDSGPRDLDRVAPQVQTVSDADRITLSAVPLKPGIVHPGQRGVNVLHLVASNSYDTDRTLTALTLSDRTTGSGTQAERDREIQTLWVRDGAAAVAAPLDTVPVLASGYFDQGRAVLTGLQWVVPARGTRHLWVSADVSADEAADGDVLGCAVDSAQGVAFAEPTTVISAWPLDSDAHWTVDGFVAAQLGLGPVSPATLAPGDGPALALDIHVPGNGYRADVLEGVRVTGLGTAMPADLSAMRLWADGGDGVFTGTGDDVALGTLVAVTGGWQSPLLAHPVPAAGARLYVSVDVAAAAAESATVRLAVPIDGIRMASGNDGPLDRAVESPGTLLLSRAPLLANFVVAGASTIGQTVTLRMLVRNAGDETVRGVTPATPVPAGTGALALAGGPTPAAFDLAPAAVDTFTWTYTAIATGDARWSADVGGTGDPSGLARHAPAVTSGPHRVYRGATRLDLAPVQTMPAAVRRGQADVVPFSLTLTNPGGASASDVRVRRLRLRLADESGQPVVPASLLARVVVNEGTNVYLDRTALETTGDQVDLTLASAVSVSGTEPTTLNLRLTVSDTTRVTGFRVEIPDSTWIEAEDATSGAPAAAHLTSGTYPVRSTVARVVEDATALWVSPGAADSVRVGRGATGVTLLRARLEDPGLPGITADVRVTRFGIVLRDVADAPIAQPGTRLAALRVVRDGQTIGTLALTPASGPLLDLPLALPLTVAGGAPVDLAVVGDIADGAPLGAIRLALRDSSTIEALDDVSRLPVSVHYTAPDVAGGLVRVEAAADSIRLAHVPLLPDTVTLGAMRVPALELALRHPGVPGVARVRLDSLHVACRDALGNPLSPATFLGRVRLARAGVEVAVSPDATSPAHLTLAPAALWIAPGDTARLVVALDVTPTAPAGTLELVLGSFAVFASDANSGAPVAPVAEPLVEMPLRSGIAVVRSPSREMAVRLASRMPAALAADGQPLSAAVLTLSDTDTQGGGGIQLEWLRVMAGDEGRGTLAAGAVAERVEAWVGGVRWAVSPTLTADSTTALLAGAAPLEVPHAGRVEVELRWVPSAGATAGRVRLGWDRACFGVAQPAGALFAVVVRADSGQAFPLWTESGGFVAATFAASVSNYPNPFAAGREATTFAYYLPADADVTLRILTPTGESVALLADGAARAAGVHETDRWDGRNGRGDAVRNGVYVAELVARFGDGRRERVLRKVAVVR